MRKITGVVDYGAGNLFSVLRSLRKANVATEIVSSLEDILRVDYLIVPGVGAFGDRVRHMREHGIFEAIKKFVQTGKPVLGICLGTQLFLSCSHEFGRHEGLNIISGEVNRIPQEKDLAVPHVGWASLKGERSYENTPLWMVSDKDYFYFTHSFVCFPDDPKNVLAKFSYGANDLPAVIAKDNVIGCQFHPELSSYPGIQLLKNFHQM